MPTRSPLRRLAMLATAAALALSGLAAVVSTAAAATAAAAAPAAVSPVVQPSSTNVTADPLPTVQIDGVAWSQVIVGNTVYVGGKFANAFPYGTTNNSTNDITRTNLLAYNLTTGVLVSSFDPVLNGQVLAVAASPDGSVLYVGGDFTTVNGVTHNHLAAFNTSTGALISGFVPNLNGSVRAVIATASTVYAGGQFTAANGSSRNYLAAFAPGTGALTTWHPTAGFRVNALVLSPDRTRVIVGGTFSVLNGATADGMGSVSATTGATMPWAANQRLQDYTVTTDAPGSGSAITSLATDGTSIFGTGYNFLTKHPNPASNYGSFEGTFSANPTTGAINWLEACHGDTYDVFPVNGIAYTVSHAHYCGNDGGWQESNPEQYRHTVAFTTQATGTLSTYTGGGNYNNFGGLPSPSIINWFPDYLTGTVTGQGQAAWTVTGNATYLVEGGEFPAVNNKPQAGLTRFAVRGTAGNPGTQGPRLSGTSFQPTLTALSDTSIRVSFGSNWDRDDMTLTYKIVRNGVTVSTVTANSQWWNLPTLTYTDTGLSPGTSYTYQITATDPHGNAVTGAAVAKTTGGTPPRSGGTAYDQQVLADGASSYWTLGEASGSTSASSVGTNPLVFAAGVTRGASGPVPPETASSFNGTSTGTGSTQTAIAGPNTFTISAWVKTSSTAGGKILGFGSASTGLSAQSDRELYLDNAGHVYFGVYLSGAATTVVSTATINNGAWHLVTASLGAGGMVLYVDGVQVGARTDATKGQTYNGYWRVGGDQISASWPGSPTSKFINATIGDVAIFPTVLSAATVQREYKAA